MIFTKIKKEFSVIFVYFLIISCAFSDSDIRFNSDSSVKENPQIIKEFTQENAISVVKKMGFGWNLGNTFDATGSRGMNSETSWSQPKTTKQMIDGIAKSGVKTIRIPVSWSNHFIDRNYTIDSEWMNRVKEVVDWAIDNELYVIINSHHDCFDQNRKMTAQKGYYPSEQNYEESARYLKNVWSQICLAFNNNYDEHLIFETMNEPRLRGTNYEWWSDWNQEICKEAADTLNKLNQVALDTIRSSGGNNEKRFVMCPGLAASPDSAFADTFKMPEDSIKENGKEHLILSVHAYSPYDFAMQSPGSVKFGNKHAQALASMFKNLDEKFIKNGYAVIIGEYGCVNKNNTDERVKWFNVYLRQAKKYGITCCLWDNGSWEISGNADNRFEEKFGYYNRNQQTWYFPEILSKMNEIYSE